MSDLRFLNHLTGCKEKTLTKNLSKAIITFVALG